MLAGAQIVDDSSVAYSAENNTISPPISGTQPGIIAETSYGFQPPDASPTRRPTKEPVDIQFTNITCTVKLGINKGN